MEDGKGHIEQIQSQLSEATARAAQAEGKVEQLLQELETKQATYSTEQEVCALVEAVNILVCLGLQEKR